MSSEQLAKFFKNLEHMDEELDKIPCSKGSPRSTLIPIFRKLGLVQKIMRGTR